MKLHTKIAVTVNLFSIGTLICTAGIVIYLFSQGLVLQKENDAIALAQLVALNVDFVGRIPDIVDDALGDHMVVQARIAAHLVAVAEGSAHMSAEEIKPILVDITKHTVLDEFWITDSEGHAYLTNTDIDFTFSPDPKEQPQASEFYKLLTQENGKVIQGTREREIGGLYKYVGVSGVDKPRIVQVGYSATAMRTLEQMLDFQVLLNRLVSSRSDLQAIELADINYEIVTSGGERPSRLAEFAEEKEIMRQAVQENRAVSSQEGDFLVVAVPVTKSAVAGGEPKPTGAVLIYLSLAELQQTIGQAMLFSLILCVVVVLVGTAFYGLFITRALLHPIEAMISLAQQIARGDLSHHVEAGREARRKDEIGQLEEALTQMSVNLRATIGHIQQAALRISTSSEQIAATLHQQAAISSQQAVATSQTTAATEELAATARQIAEATEQVVELAARNQEEAQRGVQAVSQTVEKMDEIEKGNEASLGEIMALSDRSRRIGEVMGFISGITDQTRLIAFNAAIEASAAGEIGRRFGVVATQVRELAGDVNRATEEIRERIGEIQVATNELAIASEQRGKRVAEGAEQTDVTAEVLEEILERANDVTEVAWQISLGTRQQQTAAEQAVDALREIAAGAKQVEEGCQQTTRVVAEDLVTLAEELRQAVQHFQLPASEVALETEGSDAKD